MAPSMALGLSADSGDSLTINISPRKVRTVATTRNGDQEVMRHTNHHGGAEYQSTDAGTAVEYAERNPVLPPYNVNFCPEQSFHYSECRSRAAFVSALLSEVTRGVRSIPEGDPSFGIHRVLWAQCSTRRVVFTQVSAVKVRVAIVVGTLDIDKRNREYGMK